MDLAKRLTLGKCRTRLPSVFQAQLFFPQQLLGISPEFIFFGLRPNRKVRSESVREEVRGQIPRCLTLVVFLPSFRSHIGRAGGSQSLGYPQMTLGVQRHSVDARYRIAWTPKRGSPKRICNPNPQKHACCTQKRPCFPPRCGSKKWNPFFTPWMETKTKSGLPALKF